MQYNEMLEKSNKLSRTAGPAVSPTILSLSIYLSYKNRQFFPDK